MARSLRRLVNSVAPDQNNSISLSGAEFNSDSAGDIETDYTFYDDAEYASVALFFPGSIVRLATSASRLCPTTGTVDATKGAELKVAIGYANDNGLRVLVDLHDYGRKYISSVERQIGSAEYTQANFVSDLTAIATYLDGTAGFWGIGLSNEPHDMLTATDSSNYNTIATWTLAANAGTLAIKGVSSDIKTLVCTDNWSGFQNLVATYPTNPFTNTDYVEIHCYFDSDNSGAYSGANTYFSGSGRDIRYGGETLDACAIWARDNDTKLWIGEVGVPAYDEAYITMLNDLYKVVALNNDVIKGTNYWAIKTGWYISANNACDLTNAQEQMSVVGHYVGVNL